MVSFNIRQNWLIIKFKVKNIFCRGASWLFYDNSIFLTYMIIFKLQYPTYLLTTSAWKCTHRKTANAKAQLLISNVSLIMGQFVLILKPNKTQDWFFHLENIIVMFHAIMGWGLQSWKANSADNPSGILNILTFNWNEYRYLHFIFILDLNASIAAVNTRWRWMLIIVLGLTCRRWSL